MLLLRLLLLLLLLLRLLLHLLLLRLLLHHHLLLLLLLLLLRLRLIRHYNLYKVLACSTTFFQPYQFSATFFQLHMFMLSISKRPSFFRRVLGLPIGLLDTSFHLLIFCTILSSAMRSTWPNQITLFF